MGIRRGHRRSIAALEVGVRGRIVKGSGVERSEWSALRFLKSEWCELELRSVIYTSANTQWY